MRKHVNLWIVHERWMLMSLLSADGIHLFRESRYLLFAFNEQSLIDKGAFLYVLKVI